MNIILSPEILDEYFTNKSKSRKKTNYEKALELALEEDNQIILTDSFLKDFEDYFRNNNRYDLFTRYLLESIDNNCIRKEASSIPKNDTVNNKMISLYKKTEMKYPLLLVYSDNDAITQNVHEKDLYVHSRKTQDHFNIGFIKLLLAGRQVIERDYTDFKSDEEIKLFIKNFFLIKNSIAQDVVYIFNRESNCHEHDLFNYLHTKNYEVKFYTKNFKAENSRQAIDNDIHKKNLGALKKYFGKNFNYFLTNDPNLLHERRLIIDSLSLRCDDDFNNVSIKRKTWTLTLTFNKSKTDAYLNKCAAFKPFTLR